MPAVVFWKSAMTCLLAVFITEKPTTLTESLPPLPPPLAGSEQAAVGGQGGGEGGCAEPPATESGESWTGA